MNLIDYFGNSRTKAIASDSPERIAVDLMMTISQAEKEATEKGNYLGMPYQPYRDYYLSLYQECLNKVKGV